MHYQDDNWNGSNGLINLVTIYTGYEDPSEWKKYFIMQYTGLKDDNGTEIYGGDIVEIQDDVETKTSYRSTVRITPYGVLVDGHPAHKAIGLGEDRLLADFCYYGKCKVLGNIYENPELLEVGE